MYRYLLLFLMAVAGWSQVVDGTRVGAPLDLKGNWKFHTGDDPRWASPAWDDRAWEQIPAPKGWTASGHQGYFGFAWYRLAVQTTPGQKDWALSVGPVEDVYEAYVNGVRIGQLGQFPPATQIFFTRAMSFAIPDAARQTNGRMVVALRIWRARFASDGIGPEGGLTAGPLLLGPQTAVDSVVQLSRSQKLQQQLPLIVKFIVEILTAFAFGCLFFVQRDRREYLWFSLCLLDFATLYLGNVLATNTFLLSYQNWRMTQLLYGPFFALMMQFLCTLFSVPFRPWMRVVQWSLCVFYPFVIFFPETVPAWPVVILQVFYFLPGLWIAWSRRRQGLREAKLLLIPLGLFLGSVLLSLMSYLAARLGWLDRPWNLAFSVGGVPVSFVTIAYLMFLVTMGLVLIDRFARTRSEREQMEKELESARAVQSLLVPDKPPRLRDFAVESLYVPAQQVGGDFFQVLPQQDGALLVVLGDVSGKGLQAAMLVSSIVGIVQTVAHEGCGPAEMLGRINTVLCPMLSPGSYATCTCLRWEPTQGVVRLSNAGHLSPYRYRRQTDQWEEVETLPGLPLGIAGEMEYEESRFALEPGDRFVLISDGLVETRSQSGELLGFERMTALLQEKKRLPVQDLPRSLALAAHAFGKQGVPDDDLSVVAVEFRPAPAGVEVAAAR